MVRLFDNDNEAEIGPITEDQLNFLQEELVEETLDAYTFALSPGSIETLKNNGGDPDLVTMLRTAIGNRSSMEIRYELD
jgi:hypothetical protein